MWEVEVVTTVLAAGSILQAEVAGLMTAEEEVTTLREGGAWTWVDVAAWTWGVGVGWICLEGEALTWGAVVWMGVEEVWT